MTKFKLLLASMAMGLLAILSSQAMAQSAILANLGTPTCHGHNPSPDVVQGLFYFTLPDADGDTNGTVNPWTQFGSPRFATYSALVPRPGDVNDNTTIVRFDLDTSRKQMTAIVGTVDPENIWRFFQADRVHHTRVKIAEVTGYDIEKALGVNTVYLSMTMPAGKKYNQIVMVTSGRVALEFADLNIRCPQAANAIDTGAFARYAQNVTVTTGSAPVLSVD